MVSSVETDWPGPETSLSSSESSHLLDQSTMASTTQQDLCGQALDLGLPSEIEAHPPTIKAAPEKEAPRFESFPPEIRNKIYRYLFPPAEECKVLRRFKSSPPWTYVFHVAILRTNRLISQEASSMLYGDNILVFINWSIQNKIDFLVVNRSLQHVAVKFVPNATLPPPNVVHINHQLEYDQGARLSVIVAAADVKFVCEAFLDLFRCLRSQPRATFSLVAIPQLGWSHKKLLEMVWLPLRALREKVLPKVEEPECRPLKVMDYTGVFEQTDENFDLKEESEQESDTDSERESDTGEDQSDESGSEGNGRQSNIDKVEEDVMGSTSTNSDEADSCEEDADEHGGAEDGSDRATDNKHCSNDPAEKMAHGVASKPGHDGDAKTAVLVKDKSVAGGRSDDELDHKMRGDNQSDGQHEEEIDKRNAKDEST